MGYTHGIIAMVTLHKRFVRFRYQTIHPSVGSGYFDGDLCRLWLEPNDYVPLGVPGITMLITGHPLPPVTLSLLNNHILNLVQFQSLDLYLKIMILIFNNYCIFP